MKRVFIVLFVLGWSLTALAQPPEATLIIVTDTGVQMEEDGLCTLPEAIFSAGIFTVQPPAEGECALGGGRARIVLQSGQTYRVDLKPHELFTIPDENYPSTAFAVTFPHGGITITTDGEEPAIIMRDENSEPFRLFFVAMYASLTLENVILTGGLLEEGVGGGVLNRGELTLEDVVLHDNRAPSGGALVSIGMLTIRRSSIYANHSSGSGGGVLLTATASIEDTQITGNSASGNGGGIHMDGFAVPADITLTRVTIMDNTAGNGGGIYNMVASLTLVDSVVQNNSAQSYGGGIYYYDFDLVNLLSLINSTVSGNSAAYGGGLLSMTGMLRLENSSIHDNSASELGADIYFLPPSPG